jgi:hypothetical protein
MNMNAVKSIVVSASALMAIFLATNLLWYNFSTTRTDGETSEVPLNPASDEIPASPSIDQSYFSESWRSAVLIHIEPSPGSNLETTIRRGSFTLGDEF